MDGFFFFFTQQRNCILFNIISATDRRRTEINCRNNYCVSPGINYGISLILAGGNTAPRLKKNGRLQFWSEEISQIEYKTRPDIQYKTVQ